MRELAHGLGQAVEDLHINARVRGLCVRAQHRILLNPSGYGPRDEFTIGHELMELYIPREWLSLPEATKERLCDRGAAALILPRAEFLASVERHGRNVHALHREWPRASGQVIKARLLELGVTGEVALAV